MPNHFKPVMNIIDMDYFLAYDNCQVEQRTNK